MRIIAGKFKGRPLASPPDEKTRPTSDRTRESLFNILENGLGLVFEQCRVLDLFAGTGALGLEALSRGAISAVFVEQSPIARAVIQQNIEAFALQGRTRILRRDATNLGNIGRMQPFDLVFVDPPYGQGLGEKALSCALAGGWLVADATLILEEAATSTVQSPIGFILQDERHYSSSSLYFYKTRANCLEKREAVSGLKDAAKTKNESISLR